MGSLLLVFLAAAGVAAPQPDGTLVLGVIGNDRSASAVQGERAMVADPRTGATHARRLAGGTLCHGPLMAVGDRVVYSGYDGRRPAALSLPLTLAGKPASLGAADTITSSATPGHVWLGRWRHGRKRSRVALREVAVSDGGVAARSDGVLPRWSHLDLATPAGFRLAREVRTGVPMAADAQRLAWCRGRCAGLSVWSGRETIRLDPPQGWRLGFGRGAFSPDGSLLALSLTRGDRTGAGVVDLATRRWTLVPGGELRGYDTLAWSPSGRWLYFTGPGRGLYGWERGGARASRLPIDAHGTVLSIAATE